MNQRRNALLKGLAAIAAVIVICISLGRIIGIGSQTLGDIAREHPQPTATPRNEENTESLGNGTPEGTGPGESQGAEGNTRPEGESPGSTLSDVAGSRDPSYDIQNTPAPGGDVMTDNLQNMTESDGLLSLPGLALNGEFMADARITWEE